MGGTTGAKIGVASDLTVANPDRSPLLREDSPLLYCRVRQTECQRLVA